MDGTLEGVVLLYAISNDRMGAVELATEAVDGALEGTIDGSAPLSALVSFKNVGLEEMLGAVLEEGIDEELAVGRLFPGSWSSAVEEGAAD